LLSLLRSPALTLFAAIPFAACGGGCLSASRPVATTDVLEVTVTPGWPMFGCRTRPEWRYLADLAHGRLHFQRTCPDDAATARDVPLSNADAQSIATLARAMLGAPGPHLLAAGCGSVTDGNDIAVTVLHDDGRRELYGCRAPRGATPIGQHEFDALQQRLDQLSAPSRP
jgi:hypothetical protein